MDLIREAHDYKIQWFDFSQVIDPFNESYIGLFLGSKR